MNEITHFRCYDFGSHLILDALSEHGQKYPVAERSKYKDWNNNKKIAEDAALFYAGFTNGGSLSTAWSNYLGFSPVSDFEFGTYSYYHIKLN